MKKLLLYTFIILLFTSCNDPLDEFIFSSGAQLCGNFFILGDTLEIPNMEDNEISQFSKRDTYSIYCDELGVYVLGSGTPTKQLLAIDKLTVSVDSNQRIDSLAGRWRTLTPSGRNILDSLQSSPDSAIYADSIHYYKQTLKMANNVQQILFNIQSDFNEPHFRNPVGWSTENGSVSFYTDSKTFNKEEIVNVVSTMIKEF